MSFHTKLGLVTLIILTALICLAGFLGPKVNLTGLIPSQTFKFDFESKNIKEDEALKGIVQKNLQRVGETGSFAVYIEDLSTGKHEGYSFNEAGPFPAASLYKLIVMAAIFKEIEGGSLSLDDGISASKAHLEAILGSEDFGYAEAPAAISYTVGEALDRVARVSDNYAAIMLTEKLRVAREERGEEDKLLVQMARDLGMKSTSFETDPITTTAEDIAAYFRKLYLGEIVSPQSSKQIINLLLKSQLNNRIPSKLPKGVKVAHKTGELSRIRHDAGIVFINSDKRQESRVKEEEATDSAKEPEKAYLIVLLSKALEDEDEGVEVLANISKDVYEYFTSLK